MLIKFTNPGRRLAGELRSKLIDPRSDLYQFLEDQRAQLVKSNKDIGDKRMDFHIELIKSTEVPTEELLVSRARLIQDYNIQNLGLTRMGKALVILGPDVMGYGKTHITVAFYPNGFK